MGRTDLVDLQNFPMDSLITELESLSEKVKTNREDVLAILLSKLKSIKIFDSEDLEPFDKLLMMQQCILNTYYAIRRSAKGSEGLLLFRDGSRLGNQLEEFIKKNVKPYGGSVTAPHKVKNNDPTMRVFTPIINHAFINSAYNMLRVVSTKKQTLIDEMLEKLILINFTSDSDEKKKSLAAEFLINTYNALNSGSTLTKELKKFLISRGCTLEPQNNDQQINHVSVSKLTIN